MAEHLLEVEGLKKYFPIKEGVFSKTVGHVKAVDHVSFKIKQGEIFGLVGESGCGKTTVGRTLLSLLEPTEGLVKFDQQILYNTETGERINKNDLRKLRKEMQIIFQDPYASLDPRMNVGMIVSEGLRKHKLVKNKKEAIEKSKELLELCGLEGSNVRKYPHEFSGGQRQRIGVARALALEPKFLVADEPIAALDVSIQAQMLKFMTDLKDRLGLTYLFISHDLSVVRYFCDRVAVMYLGSFAEQAPTKKLFKKPLHPYTQSLLSAVPKSDPAVKKKREILKGDVPSPADPPSGCKFHTRCKYAEDKCKIKIPVYREIEPDHFVSCHLAEKINQINNHL
ncbi:ABC transporter ATP-binding protein [Isachenkonia alkalipeptolytica]|uniref:ABC transporter ATP-binding protein n=1 Tax=Isachenkonia alkalipeptolytica TaxID=2565777 RepID=A0AA44BEK6_9CLOT|nr:ABC transporter ATP-binding protein [Isachenkonia alkalipeptolytica]NBG89369.1 ABC transporter ATP-binding protein [Isachenkonia alkalipeptolytica]